MLIRFGALLHPQGIIREIYRRWRHGHLEPDLPESASTVLSSWRGRNISRNVLNQEIDELEARLAAFQKEDQVRRVRGYHFGRTDELLPLDEVSRLLITQSEASSSQRSSWISLVSYSTPPSSAFSGDEVELIKETATEKDDQDASRLILNADQLRPWLKNAAHRFWNKPPAKDEYLEPCSILVSIIEPLPQTFRSLDVPCPSSVTSYKQSSYLPETDTFFLPVVAGGPFEIAATEAEFGRWIEVTPEKFWKFRSSALRELKETGKLHWRKVDRWGKGWQEGWWRGKERPLWDQGTKKWVCEVLRF